jgi:hypothetical protein
MKEKKNIKKTDNSNQIWYHLGLFFRIVTIEDNHAN